MGRHIFKWTVQLGLVYAFVVLAFFFLQKTLTYYPETSLFVPNEWQLNELQTLNLTTSDGLAIHSWFRPPVPPRQLTVVFFQGNRQHVGYRNKKIRPLLDKGYGVLLVGYRGYGGNPGSPSEDGLYRDARAAISAIIQAGEPEASQVFYGESLGTGVAVQMATEYHPLAIILEGAYTTLPDVGADYYPWLPVRAMMKDQYDSLSKVGKVQAPLLLIHGDDDTVVPYELGKKLYKAANEPKQGFFPRNAGHNNLYDFGAGERIMGFLGELSP